MIRRIRQPLAALFLVLLPALAAAPRGDVCAHGSTAAAATEHDGHHQHAAAPGDQQQHDVPGCPMDAGQAGCTTQAPLPVAGAPVLAVAMLGAEQPVAASLQPTALDPTSIFHPPRS